MNKIKMFFGNTTLYKRAVNAIGRSLDGTSEKTSSVRIQAYVLLIPVLLASLVFVSIEAVNAIVAWNNQVAYVPSNESIIIFGMILSHHISVLFTRTKPKNYYEVKDKKEDKEEDTDKPEDNDVVIVDNHNHEHNHEHNHNRGNNNHNNNNNNTRRDNIPTDKPKPRGRVLNNPLGMPPPAMIQQPEIVNNEENAENTIINYGDNNGEDIEGSEEVPDEEIQ